MIVELVGAPAAGKSYLAPRLAAESGVPVIQIGRWGQRYFYFWIFAAMNWRLTRRVIRESNLENRAHPEMRIVRKIPTFMRMGAKFAKARLLGRGLVIEGVYQTLAALFEDPVSADELKTYLDLARWKPDRVYIIRANRELRMRRMRERNSIPRERLGEAHWRRHHDVVECNLAVLETVLQGVKPIIVDNNKPADS